MSNVIRNGGPRGRGGTLGHSPPPANGNGSGESPVEQVPEYREATLIAMKAKNALVELGINPVDPIMPGNQDPGEYCENKLELKTNLYGIKMQAGKPIYRYYVNVQLGRSVDETRYGHSPSISSDENGNGNGHGNGNGNGNGHTNGSMSPQHSHEEPSIRLINFSQLRRRGDPQIVARREEYAKIWARVFASKQLPGAKEGYYFDMENTLYSVQYVQEPKVITVPTDPFLFPEFQTIVFTLKYTGVLVLGDLHREVNLDLTQCNSETMRFLEMATSTYPMLNSDEFIVFSGGKIYMKQHDKYGFDRSDLVDLPECNVVGLGLQKSIRYVEGPRGRGMFNAGVVVESKKTPFHDTVSIVDKAYEMKLLDDYGAVRNGYNAKHFNDKFKGLYVYSKVQKNKLREENSTRKPTLHRIVAIDTNYTSRTKTFPLRDSQGNERQISILAYYQEHYGKTLQYPDSPIVEIKLNPRNKVYFPMEMLEIVEYQRVTSSQQSPDLIAKLIRACAIVPPKMDDQITKCVNALRLNNVHGYSQYLQAADLTVVSRPLYVTARQLSHPMIMYGRNSSARVNERGGFQAERGASFFIPAICNRWVAAFIHDGKMRPDVMERTLSDLTNRLFKTGQDRGMSIQAPYKTTFINNTKEDLKKHFQLLQKHEVEFAFFITLDRVKNMHDFMKLYEREFNVVTMDLNSRTADNVIQKNQRITLENLVMKMNVKLGGLNHSIKLRPEFQQMIDPKILVIGFGMNHPVGGMVEPEELTEVPSNEELKRQQGKLIPPPPPSVVGFAANDGKSPFEFTGDYVFQPANRDEKITMISRSKAENVPLLVDVIKTVLERFQKNRGFMPEHIVLYRNGASEGQYANIIVHEVPFVKQALKEIRCNAKLLFIVPNRMHPVRLYPETADTRLFKAPDLNVKPGYVVDTGIVHPTWYEFYLCSHTTLQGTAKVPRYTVIWDETNFKADQVQQMTYALAYGHQVVNSPTSVPSPAYIAGRYAERGRKVYKAFLDSGNADYIQLEDYFRGHTNQKPVFLDNYGADELADEQVVKIRILNEKITLHEQPNLRGRRVNA